MNRTDLLWMLNNETRGNITETIIADMPSVFEVESGPFVTIARNIWPNLRAGVGFRGSNHAQIGPLNLLLIDDNPSYPWELWCIDDDSPYYTDMPRDNEAQSPRPPA